MVDQILNLTTEEIAVINARRAVEKTGSPQKREIFGYFKVLVGIHVQNDENGVEQTYNPTSGAFPSYSDLCARLGDDKFQLVSKGPQNPRSAVGQAAFEGFNSNAPHTAFNPKEDTFDAMTVEELKSYAASEEIDLGKAKTKAEIIAVVRQNS